MTLSNNYENGEQESEQHQLEGLLHTPDNVEFSQSLQPAPDIQLKDVYGESSSASSNDNDEDISSSEFSVDGIAKFVGYVLELFFLKVEMIILIIMMNLRRKPGIANKKCLWNSHLNSHL